MTRARAPLPRAVCRYVCEEPLPEIVDFARAVAIAMAQVASGDVVDDDARLLREFSAGTAAGGGAPLPDAALLLHVVELLARSPDCGAVMVGDSRVAPVLVHIVVHAVRAAPPPPPAHAGASDAAAGAHGPGHRRHVGAAGAVGAVADRACSALAHLAAAHGQATVRALVRAGQLHHLVRLVGGPVTHAAWRVRAGRCRRVRACLSRCACRAGGSRHSTGAARRLCYARVCTLLVQASAVAHLPCAGACWDRGSSDRSSVSSGRAHRSMCARYLRPW